MTFRYNRSSRPKVFLEKSVSKTCSKYTGEHPCRSAISIELQDKIAVWHGYSPVNLLHILRIPKNNNGCF